MCHSPTVSIITPFYNSSAYVERTIKSVICQTFTDWEYVCVNDGSTDDTLHQLNEFAKIDSRIKVLNRTNGGKAAVPINAALGYCSGNYLMILYHDDELSPDLLQYAVKKAKVSNADVVLPNMGSHWPAASEKDKFYVGDSISKEFDEASVDYEKVLPPRDAFLLSLYWKIHGFGLYRMDLVKRFCYPEEGINGDEYANRFFMLRANKIAFSKGIYHYYQHNSSITRKLTVRFFDTFVTDQKLAQLLKEEAFDEMHIKKFRAFCIKKYAKQWLYYKMNKKSFTEEERGQIKNIFAGAKQWLQPGIFGYWYKIRYIFRSLSGASR